MGGMFDSAGIQSVEMAREMAREILGPLIHCFRVFLILFAVYLAISLYSVAGGGRIVGSMGCFLVAGVSISLFGS